MYEAHWQLQHKPFENCADPRFYYPGESHQAALLKLRYAVENRRSGALLSGTSGTGKTLIVNMLQSTLGERFAPFVHLVFPQMAADQLLAYLASQLAGPAERGLSCDTPQSLARIERFLAGNVEEGRHAVIVIDEAHLLADARTLEVVRLLSNFEFQSRPGTTVVLSGQTGILPALDRASSLEERLAVKCLLRPFDARETGEYVEHRLRAAGAVAGRPIFDAEALAAVHRLTHGIARRINRLCDLALLIGYAEECRTIKAAHLESIQQELVAVAPE